MHVHTRTNVRVYVYCPCDMHTLINAHPSLSLSPLLLCSPKSDTCKVCDTMKVKVDVESDESQKRELILEWEVHKVQAEASYQWLKEDAAYAKSRSDTVMFTFDLEKSLPTPVLTTGVVYYKRQLWTYNQGIHDCTTDKGCMHMWNESLASRGSHEVGSCVISHLKEIDSDATNLILYSDAYVE